MVGTPERRHAPTLATHRTGDEVKPAHTRVRQQRARLRNVADGRIAALWRVVKDADMSRGRRQQPQNCAHQRGLASAVGTEQADKFALLNRKAGVDKDSAIADDKRRVIELNDLHKEELASAVSVWSSSLSIQFW